MVNRSFYSILLLSLRWINYSTSIPVISEPSNTNQSEVEQCQHAMTYDEMRALLAHSPCASNLESKQRTKRDDDPASTNNVYALQATVDDHRTIIDDHRKMINYLMNNTVNITQLNENYADQHTNTTPLWKSWRDISLLLLMIICLCAILVYLVRRFRPLDVLTLALLRRCQKQQQQQQQQQQQENTTIHEKGTMHRNNKDVQPSMVSTIPVSTIQREYVRYQRDSNSSL